MAGAVDRAAAGGRCATLRPRDLRMRAGVVLGDLPDGLEPVPPPDRRCARPWRPARRLRADRDGLGVPAPRTSIVWWWRGHALYDLDRPAEAAASYEKAFALDPSLSNVAQETANALMDGGRACARPSEWARRAVTADPLDAGARGVLAWALPPDAAPTRKRSPRRARRSTATRSTRPRGGWSALAHLQRGDERGQCAPAVADARRASMRCCCVHRRRLAGRRNSTPCPTRCVISTHRHNTVPREDRSSSRRSREPTCRTPCAHS